MTYCARIAGALAASLTASSAPAAELGAQAQARVSIVEPMALRMQWEMAMPSVRGGADGAVFAGRMPSMSMGMMMPANARLMIRREDETGEPVTAPGAFAGGALQGRAAASIDVARGGLILASNGARTPAIAGTLVVMVQYN